MSTAKLVAVVEDEVAIRDNYLAGLRRQGYRVAGYGNRKEALAGFANRFPDLVIIDVNLGTEVEGGFELCRELRARSTQLPIIFLTARESELDAVSGLPPGPGWCPDHSAYPAAPGTARSHRHGSRSHHP
jgi:two-component system OmpR family response regulator